jgi:hypothetical protein
MRLFIYIPWTKSGLLTLFTYTLTGLFANNVFSFYGLSYSDTSQAQAESALQVEILDTSPLSREDASFDCAHFCLPGVPDVWNLMLLSRVCSMN